jgi:hypothetical protein
MRDRVSRGIERASSPRSNSLPAAPGRGLGTSRSASPWSTPRPFQPIPPFSSAASQSGGWWAVGRMDLRSPTLAVSPVIHACCNPGSFPGKNCSASAPYERSAEPIGDVTRKPVFLVLPGDTDEPRGRQPPGASLRKERSRESGVSYKPRRGASETIGA